MLHLLFSGQSFGEDWCFGTFRDYLYPHQKVTVLPFGFPHEAIHTPSQWQAYYRKQRGPYCRAVEAAFARYGIACERITWLNVFEDTGRQMEAAVKTADILYLCGAFPENTMERLRSFHLIPAVEGFAGILMGDGGGALAQLMRYHKTPGKAGERFAYGTGLRMLTGFDVELPFRGTTAQMQAIEQVRSETGYPVYAVERESALLVKNGKVEPVGKVTAYY